MRNNTYFLPGPCLHQIRFGDDFDSVRLVRIQSSTQVDFGKPTLSQQTTPQVSVYSVSVTVEFFPLFFNDDTLFVKSSCCWGCRRRGTLLLCQRNAARMCRRTLHVCCRERRLRCFSHFTRPITSTCAARRKSIAAASSPSCGVGSGIC